MVETPSVEWGEVALAAPASKTSPALSQRELFLYWSSVRAQPLPLTRAGLVRKRALVRINRQLLFPDPSLKQGSREADAPRLLFIRLLLQELGLLTQADDHIVARGQRGEVPSYWMQSLRERVWTAVAAWLHMRAWSELTSLGLSSFHLELPRARAELLNQVTLLPADTWISAERFAQRMAVTAPGLLFRQQSAYRRWAEYRERGSSSAQTVRRLAQIEAAFAGRALSGPLHWLGILDISSDEDRLLAFRLNAAGAQLLSTRRGGEQTIEGDADQGKLIVQPNFHILALGPAPEATLAVLETFAERVKADPTAFEYILSRESAYRAEQNGMPVSDILAFLGKQCAQPLPENVARTLQEWELRHERIVFRRDVALCHTASARLLTDLLAEPGTGEHLEQQVTPTVATVKGGHLGSLREALLKRGELPAFSSGFSPSPGLVVAAPDGELRPVHEGPNLLLDAQLRRLAEERDGRFYVTEESVTRAVSAGMTVSDYLAQLAGLHRGPLPLALQTRVKAWGHYYGQASLQTAGLLRVKDSETADELVTDPELGPYLQRFSADPSGTVLLVHNKDVEVVRRLLCERGIELT